MIFSAKQLLLTGRTCAFTLSSSQSSPSHHRDPQVNRFIWPIAEWPWWSVCNTQLFPSGILLPCCPIAHNHLLCLGNPFPFTQLSSGHPVRVHPLILNYSTSWSVHAPFCVLVTGEVSVYSIKCMTSVGTGGSLSLYCIGIDYLLSASALEFSSPFLNLMV